MRIWKEAFSMSKTPWNCGNLCGRARQRSTQRHKWASSRLCRCHKSVFYFGFWSKFVDTFFSMLEDTRADRYNHRIFMRWRRSTAKGHIDEKCPRSSSITDAVTRSNSNIVSSAHRVRSLPLILDICAVTAQSEAFVASYWLSAYVRCCCCCCCFSFLLNLLSLLSWSMLCWSWTHGTSACARSSIFHSNRCCFLSGERDKQLISVLLEWSSERGK